MAALSPFVESSVISASDFNKIPHIDDQRAFDDDLALKIGLIYQKHGVLDDLGLHLLHRHYKVGDDSMVHITQVADSIHVTRVVPIGSINMNATRGRLYLLNEANKFQAYEYEDGLRVKFPDAFLQELASYIQEHGLRTRVAIDTRVSDEAFPSSEFVAGSDATVTISGKVLDSVKDVRLRGVPLKKVGWKFKEVETPGGGKKLVLLNQDVYPQCCDNPNPNTDTTELAPSPSCSCPNGLGCCDNGPCTCIHTSESTPPEAKCQCKKSPPTS